MTKPLPTSEPSTRYTVQMLSVFCPGQDINGVCRQVRFSLERGIIPVIEIDTDHKNEDEEDEDEEMSTQ